MGRLSTDTNYKQVVYNIQYFWPGVYRNLAKCVAKGTRLH